MKLVYHNEKGREVAYPGKVREKTAYFTGPGGDEFARVDLETSTLYGPTGRKYLLGERYQKGDTAFWYEIEE